MPTIIMTLKVERIKDGMVRVRSRDWVLNSTFPAESHIGAMLKDDAECFIAAALDENNTLHVKDRILPVDVF